jgi:hypothetical protein
MNKRRVFFSGLVMGLVGVGLGLVLATLFDPPYESKHYRHIQRIYLIVGGAGGFIYGASISAVQQLKEIQEQRDQQIIASRRPQHHKNHE